MARVTERVRLGPAALNPFTVHPYEIAGPSRTRSVTRAMRSSGPSAG